MSSPFCFLCKVEMSLPRKTPVGAGAVGREETVVRDLDHDELGIRGGSPSGRHSGSCSGGRGAGRAGNCIATHTPRNDAAHRLLYSSWRCHWTPLSLRPLGCAVDYWYMPQGAVQAACIGGGINYGRRGRPRVQTRLCPAARVCTWPRRFPAWLQDDGSLVATLRAPSCPCDTASRCCSSVNRTLKSLPNEKAQRKARSIRRLYACSFASGAREDAPFIDLTSAVETTGVTNVAGFRWTRRSRLRHGHLRRVIPSAR